MNNEAKPQKDKDNSYRGLCLYTLTLYTEGRLPLLGELVGASPETASVVPTPLGKAVLKCWEDTPILQKEFAKKKSERTGQPCKRNLSVVVCQLMPDHFHGILFVKGKMDISVGDVARGFMVRCTKAYNKELSSMEELPLKPLWEKGFHDHVFRNIGQLHNMRAYLEDNPRRLMLKKMHPGNFAVLRDVHWDMHYFSAVGNIRLLDYPKCAVHVRSYFSDEEARDYMENCMLAARKGAVLIGAFNSPKEKQVQEEALKEGLPVICLLPHGFSVYYKPTGIFTDALSQGKMLLLTKALGDTKLGEGFFWEECLDLNALAEEIAKESF